MHTIVYFHSPCVDGTFAAYLYSRFNHVDGFMGVKAGSRIAYKPTIVSEPAAALPVSSDGKQHIIIQTSTELKTAHVFLDVTPDLDFIKQARDAGDEVYVYDHHPESPLAKTFAELKDEEKPTVFQLDTKQCTTKMLSVLYTEKLSDAMKLLVDAVNARDTWTEYRGPIADASAYIYFALLDSAPESDDTKWPHNKFAAIDELEKIPYEYVCKYGRIINQLKYQQVTYRARTARDAIFTAPDGKKYRVKCYPADMYKSDAGNALLEANPDIDFTVAWEYDPHTNYFWLSLRGRDAGVATSDIAKQFIAKNGRPGGGHRNAAGCEFEYPMSSHIEFITTS